MGVILFRDCFMAKKRADGAFGSADFDWQSDGLVKLTVMRQEPLALHRVRSTAAQTADRPKAEITATP
jgi:hypothetical protein